ncbi:MAG: thioredoxin family protein [Desulfobulbaceae bacterium]|nr:thioredoxin family protein [Desulfobulbaceae bacterium]HIJ78473.1 thioredoxin family protein [Deltaproteobacteria bacterium]
MTKDHNDIPAPRTIKIGKASVGLIGFDEAMNKIMGKKMTEEEAVTHLYQSIRDKNYIPATAADLYRKALRQEYRRRCGLKTDESPPLTIRVLGKNCVSCNRMNSLLFEILQKLNLAADMESVHDPDEIYRFGVTRTPALIINNRVKCAGRTPSPVEIEMWLQEETP